MPEVKFFTIKGKKIPATKEDNKKIKSCELNFREDNKYNKHAVCRSSRSKKVANLIKEGKR